MIPLPTASYLLLSPRLSTPASGHLAADTSGVPLPTSESCRCDVLPECSSPVIRMGSLFPLLRSLLGEFVHTHPSKIQLPPSWYFDPLPASFLLLIHIYYESIIHPAFTPVFIFQQLGCIKAGANSNDCKVSFFSVYFPPYLPSFTFPNEHRLLCAQESGLSVWLLPLNNDLITMHC